MSENKNLFCLFSIRLGSGREMFPNFHFQSTKHFVI